MSWTMFVHNAARPGCWGTRSMRRLTSLTPFGKPAQVKGAGMALVVFFLLTGQLMAQENAPVDVTGTQVATEQTPAAATNSDALRKAAQNPIASLISVPVQNIDNFNIQPGNRTQNVLNIQPVIPLNLSANWNLIVRWITPIIYQPIPVPQPPGPPVQTTGVSGLGDMNPSFFLVPKKKQDHLGHWTDGVVAHGNEYHLSRSGQTRPGANRGRAGAATTLDDRGSYQQYLVCSRTFQSGQTGGEPVPPTVVRQLQPEERLVSRRSAHSHRQLESSQR